MNSKQKLSLVSTLLAGIFATGCSQQQIQEVPVVTPEPAPAPVVVKPKPAPVVIMPAPRPKPIVKPAPRRPVSNGNCHHHAANSRTKSVRHCHPNPKGQHHYGNRAKKQYAAPAKPRVDIQALQRKLKAKGYYRGPIDGVVGNDTRDALKRFQNR